MLKGLFKLTATAAAAAGVGYTLKNKVSAQATVSRAVNAAKVTVKSEKDYDNGVALTPPMGWSSWNTFRNNISDELIMEIANAMANSGLKDAGYQYVNLDDCWQSSSRDENGKFQADMTRFPRGIKPLAEDVNALGLKLGIYSSNGTHTCEDLPASLGNEAIDAQTFAEWGIEYFKYDFCYSKPIPSSAPKIAKITLGKIGGSEIVTVYAPQAKLEGHARLVNDSKNSIDYITGLDGNIGSATFEGITVPEDGEYVLTIGMRKSGYHHKYAKILINGETEFEFTVPPTRGATPDGRHQVIITLKAGENTLKFFNPISSRMDGAARQYINMGKELKKATKAYAEKHNTAEKPICYSICEWGFNRPYVWGKEAGNLWRTTLDIMPNWKSIIAIYEANVRLAKYAGPGGWNDPDMLEVGNGNLTLEENKAHFTLWCMMAAPLILGNDIRTFIDENGQAKKDDEILKILTNKRLIAIDQDELGIQCRRHKTNIKVDVLVKPLANRETAVCFFNKFGEEATESVSIKELLGTEYCNLPEAESYECSELWFNESEVTSDNLGARIPPHGVRIFKIKAL